MGQGGEGTEGGKYEEKVVGLFMVVGLTGTPTTGTTFVIVFFVVVSVSASIRTTF